MRLQQRGVHGEVGRRPRVRLHIDAPLGGIKSKRGQCARNAQILDLVNVLIAAVVALARQSLAVLVRQRRTESLDHSARREVLLASRSSGRQQQRQKSARYVRAAQVCQRDGGSEREMRRLHSDLGRDELESLPLSRLLSLQQVIDLRISLL